MAYAFPLSLAQFFDRWDKLPFRVQPSDPVVVSRTRGGEVLTAQVGNVVWTGEVEFATRRHQAAESAAAMLQLLRRPGATFLARPFRCGPAADPAGTILGAATPKIDLIDSNRRDVRIKDLPAGYVISTGDYLSYTYGSSPTRYALHQVAKGGTANGAGVLAGVEVTPPMPAGASATLAITLVKPAFKAVLADAPRYGVAKGGLQFSFVQTMR